MMENEKLLTSETDPDLLAMAQEEKIRLRRPKEQEGNLQRALLPEDPLDQKILLSRSAQEPAVTKLHYLLRNSTGCTRDTQNLENGASRL